MAATYTPISLSEMRDLLKADKGWHPADPATLPNKCEEHVFDFDLTVAGEPSGIVIRVYTSIKLSNGVSRKCGGDAIRVCAVDFRGESARGYIKSKRVHRVENWRANLKARIIDVLERARDRLMYELFKQEGKADNIVLSEAGLGFPAFATKAECGMYIRARLGTDAAFAREALLWIFEMQTEDEQEAGDTVHHNGVGFTGIDAELLTSFAKQLIAKREKFGADAWLSKKQEELLLKKMPKYARQVIARLEADGHFAKGAA